MDDIMGNKEKEQAKKTAWQVLTILIQAVVSALVARIPWRRK